MSSSPVSVAVVVVSYNSAKDLPACLESIRAAGSPTVRPDVVVVDNASSDESVTLVQRDHPEVRLVRAGGNVGFAKAANLGAAVARGDFLLLLNPDAVLLPGALDALVSFAVAHPQHGLYGGRVVLPDGTNDPSSCWGDMTLRSLACFATGLSTAFPRSRLLDPESLGTWQRDDVREVPVITGCLLLVRREIWHALGGMDETYWLYGEDADLSVRARMRGYRPVIVPAAEIRHAKGGSSSGSSKMPLVMAGRATLIRRRWQRPSQALGLRLLVAGAGLRAALARLTGAGGADWPAVWATRSVWRQGYPAALQLAPSAVAASACRSDPTPRSLL